MIKEYYFKQKTKLQQLKQKSLLQYSRLNKPRFWGAFGTLVIAITALSNSDILPNGTSASSIGVTKTEIGSFDIPDYNQKYGFVLDNYEVVESEIQNNEFLSQILTKHEVPYPQIDQLARRAKDIFDVRGLRVGKGYTILKDKETGKATHFIYEPSVYKYVVYDLQDSTNVEIVERAIQTEIRESSGIIESSLWNAMIDNGMNFDLASRMEDALAWSVDFYHIQKDDRFKLIYEQNYIDGKKVGVGKLIAAYFKHYDLDYYAFHFKNEKHEGFFDEEGRSMKKVFLKSPVKYARISSAFNPRRFHPILRRVKPHLGTDYAAPHGSPILATADGTVTKASYSRGNGRYVKLRHDKVYETQYLHMSRFAKGIRPGVRVKQGQCIGYVGSTGLATGPHVCYRFWKNGKQVNPKREKLPPPEPMPKEDLPKFMVLKDSLKTQLDAIPFQEIAREEMAENIDSLKVLSQKNP